MDRLERLSVRETDLDPALVHGIFGGLIAGTVYTLFQMYAASMITAYGDFSHPLRMIAGMIFGPKALSSAFPLATAAAAGVVIDILLSMAGGIVFGALIYFAPKLLRRTTHLLAIGVAYGLSMWFVNYLILAPLFGWTWFSAQPNGYWVVDALAHAVCYGAVLGLYYDVVLGADRRLVSPFGRTR